MTWAIRLALAAIVSFGAWLRLHGSGELSIRLDEGQTIHFAQLPLQQLDSAYQHTPSLFQAVAADVHPPGYILLMHWWIGRFGTDPVMLRLPSELASIASLPLLYMLGTRLYGRRIGLLAAGIGALSPFWIWHAQEARMYSFLVFFALGATIGLIEALEDGRGRGWILFTICTALGLYFHYFAFAVLAAHVLYGVVRSWRLDFARVAPGITALITVVALYVPWVWMVGVYYRGAGDPSLALPNVYSPLLLLSDFLLGYLNVAATSQVIAAWPLLVLLALAAGAFGAHPSWRGLLLWLLFLGPIVLAFAASFVYRPLVSARYLIVATPALYILLAVTLDRVPRRRTRLIGGILLVGLMLGGLGIERVSALNPATEDYQRVAGFIHSHAQPGDVVGLDAAFNRYAYSYYADDNLPLYAIPAPSSSPGARSKLDEKAIDTYVRGLAAGHQRLWMVYYLEDERSAAVRHYLDYHSSGRIVIFGGRYGRGVPSDATSNLNVQLVLYRLPNLPQQPIQVRPLTLRQLDWLTGLPSSTRFVDDPKVGAEGETVDPMSHPVAEPRPLARWGFGALAIPAPDDVITLFNPNSSAVKVQVQAHWVMGDIVTEVAVPPLADVEFSLSHWDSRTPGLALTVIASLPVTARRTEPAGKTVINYYGRDAATAAGQHFDGQVWMGGQAQPAPAQLVQLPCGGADVWTAHLQAASGTLTVSRYLTGGQEKVLDATWSYDVAKGGVQRIASIPASALGYGNYELDLRRDGGEVTSERTAYFGIQCTPPWAVGPGRRGKGGGGDD